MTASFLVKVKNDTISVPRPTTIKNDTVVEVTVKRIFVDDATKKRIGKKGVRI